MCSNARFIDNKYFVWIGNSKVDKKSLKDNLLDILNVIFSNAYEMNDCMCANNYIKLIYDDNLLCQSNTKKDLLHWLQNLSTTKPYGWFDYLEVQNNEILNMHEFIEWHAWKKELDSVITELNKFDS